MILPLLSLAALSLIAPALPARSEGPIPLPEAPGQALLMASGERADYGPLAEHFLTQANLAYCGVASIVMVLNSLQVPGPPAAGYGSYRFWTQENLFDNPAARQVVPPATVAREGMTLQQLAGLLRSQGVRAEAVHADRLDLAAFRSLLRANLSAPSDRLVVNYDRKLLGQAGGGHIAPLAAFHAPSDRVLILDVARYRYPSVWVPTADLWRAARSRDRSSGRSRGLVMISRLP